MSLDEAAALAQIRSPHKALNSSSKMKYQLQPIVFAPLSDTLLRNH